MRKHEQPRHASPAHHTAHEVHQPRRSSRRKRHRQPYGLSRRRPTLLRATRVVAVVVAHRHVAHVRRREVQQGGGGQQKLHVQGAATACDVVCGGDGGVDDGWEHASVADGGNAADAVAGPVGNCVLGGEAHCPVGEAQQRRNLGWWLGWRRLVRVMVSVEAHVHGLCGCRGGLADGAPQ